MPYFICKGAKLKCSMGSEESELNIMHDHSPVFLHGENMANIMDYKPIVNIKPFGKCKSMANPTVAAATAANYGRLQKMPCVPSITSPWLKGKKDTYVKGQQTLMSDCKLNCAWAGVIKIADDGQNE